MFDVKSVVQHQQAVVDIKHPVTGALTGATVTLAGPEHPKRKKIVFDRQRELRQKFAKAGKLQFTDPAEEQEEAIHYLAECTLDWTGIAVDGKAVKFTADAARELYADPELAWLKTQVSEGLERVENFITTSGKA